MVRIGQTDEPGEGSPESGGASDAAPVDWFTTFFDAAANDFWQGAVPAEHTRAEVELLQRALGVENGARLLDIAAGRGRLTLPLARLGARVTAVDLSADGLAHLERRLTADLDAAVEVEVVRADMRSLPLAPGFDGAWCLGNSFGYFDVAGVERGLREVARVLRPGARFVLESATVAESLLADLAEETRHRFGGVEIVGYHRYEPEHERCVSVLHIDDGTRRSVRTMQQLVLPADRICILLEEAGLAVEHRLGGTDWRPYTAGDGSLIVVARRS